jgi:hypothetical protein
VSEASEYLGKHGFVGSEPFFDPERVVPFRERINELLGPDFADDHLETTGYDENEVAAHIGLYALISEEPEYTAKAAYLVTTYLQGETNLKNVKGANKHFKAYLPKHAPYNITGRKIDGIVEAAAQVVANCMKTGVYIPPPIKQKFGAGTDDAPRAELKELKGPISPRADAVRRFVGLCDYTVEEAITLFKLLGPNATQTTTEMVAWGTIDKIRRLVSQTTLLSQSSSTLTMGERARVSKFLNQTQPLSASMQMREMAANARDPRIVMRDLHIGLLKCAKYIEQL